MAYAVQLTIKATGELLVNEQFDDFTRAASRLAALRAGGRYDPGLYSVAIAEVRKTYFVQLIRAPQAPGEAATLDRQHGYPTREAADHLAQDWARLQGVRDGTLLVRVVERRA